MSIFNLRKLLLNKLAMSIGKHWKNLKLDEFIIQKIDGPLSEEASLTLSVDKAFGIVSGEAKVTKDRYVEKCMREYGVDKDQAESMVHIWVGYHSDYGGVTATVAPYMSEGFWHGKEHEQAEAIDKFYFGVKRTVHKTPSGVASSAKRNIKKFHDRFGLEFGLDDLKLVTYREPELTTEEMEELKKKQELTRSQGKKPRAKRKEIVALLPNLNPNTPEFITYFNENDIKIDPETMDVQVSIRGIEPRGGTQSKMHLNTKGFDKLLNHFTGKWHQRAIDMFAQKFGISREEVLQLAIKNENDIKKEQKIQNEEANNTLAPVANQFVFDIRTAAKRVAKLSSLMQVNPEDFSMENLYDVTRFLVEQDAQGKLYDEVDNRTPVERAQDVVAARNVSIPLEMQKEQVVADEHGEVYARPVYRKVEQWSPRGTMPAFGDRTFSSVFGAAGSTGVERSIDLTKKAENLKFEVKRVMESLSKSTEPISVEAVVSVLLKNPERKRSIAKNDSLDIFTSQISEIIDSLQGQAEAGATGDLGIEEQGSFHPDLQSALREAKMKFSQASKLKDPATGALLRLDPRMVQTFSVPYNITGKDLTKMRADKEAKARGEIVEETPLFGQQTPQVQTPEQVPENVTPDEILPPANRNVNRPVDVNEEDVYENAPIPRGRMPIPAMYGQRATGETRRIIVATLKSLIKIAEELDNEGKDDDAEEIHKIIRKHQRRV